ncbi:hypothetical protein Lesp02_38330 [Lentzea sp. NBRC 105346]|nr:hypothetical protein Lesp02_38330 [Lentzea sp. NBRC 105346]
MAWLGGVLAFLGLGILMFLFFAAKSAGGVAVLTGVVVALYVLLGLAVWDGRWYERIAWGVTVGLLGVVGTIFVMTLADDWHAPQLAGFVLTGISYAVVAALWARNWWVRGAGAFVLVSALMFAPAETYTEFARVFARLH